MATLMEENKQGEGEWFLRGNIDMNRFCETIGPLERKRPKYRLSLFRMGKAWRVWREAFIGNFQWREWSEMIDLQNVIVLLKKRKNVKHWSINHFPNNSDSLALKFCTRLAFVLIVNKANPWILGFLVSLVS